MSPTISNGCSHPHPLETEYPKCCLVRFGLINKTTFSMYSEMRRSATASLPDWKWRFAGEGQLFPCKRGKAGMGDLGACAQFDAPLTYKEGEYAPTPTLPRYAGEGAQHHRHEPLDLHILRWAGVGSNEPQTGPAPLRREERARCRRQLFMAASIPRVRRKESLVPLIMTRSYGHYRAGEKVAIPSLSSC